MLSVSLGAFAKGDDVAAAMRLTFQSSTAIIPDGVSDALPEGTIVVYNGREAIIVDLGGKIGKVAVATKNVGAANANRYKGTKFSYTDAMNPSKTGLSDGWYVPSKEEMDALMSRLTWNTLKTGPWDGTIAGAEINFGTTSLFLPAAGYNTSADNTQSVYWTSTKNGTSQGYRLDMASSYKYVLAGNTATQCSVRPFCALPKVINLNAPIEREHMLNASSIGSDDDGNIVLTVDGESVTYPFDMLKEVTFFNGTPTVSVKANEDPDNAGNYYSTFYSGLESYKIPEGVKAYIGRINQDVIELTEIEGDVLPRGEAVLLYSETLSNIEMSRTDEEGEMVDDSWFSGVDVATQQDDNLYYMLSYGQDKLAFYRMNSEQLLAPNKAFAEVRTEVLAKAFRFVFPGESITEGIEEVNENANEVNAKIDAIYNINGVRLDKLQKGINIVNGKKIVVK